VGTCTKCGASLAPGEVTCSQCGQAVAPPAEWSTGQSAGSAPPPSDPYAQPPGQYGPPPGQYGPPPGQYGPPGYAPPPPGYGQYGPGMQGGAGLPQLASWGTRALGYLIDVALALVILIPAFIIGLALHFIYDLGVLLDIALWVWLSVQVGQTGQSPGMRVVGIKCIGEATGTPIGPGLGVVRAIAHFVDGIICDIGWLFPLWDSKRQTLADKIMSTVVVVVPKMPFSLTPPA